MIAGRHAGCRACLAFFVVFSLMCLGFIPLGLWELTVSPAGALTLGISAWTGISARHCLRRYLGRPVMTVTADDHGITIARERKSDDHHHDPS